LGGYDQAILLECNHQITDPSNAGQILAALANDTATLVTNASFSIEAPSPVTVDTLVACQPPKTVNYTRTGLYKNQNVNPSNVDFHAPIFRGKVFGGIIIRMCSETDNGTGYVYWIDQSVTFTGGLIGPAQNTDLQRFEGTFSWMSKTDPAMYVEPAGVFE
jgi:hypothetical protein